MSPSPVQKSSFSKFDALQKKAAAAAAAQPHVNGSTHAVPGILGQEQNSVRCTACDKVVYQMEQMKVLGWTMPVTLITRLIMCVSSPHPLLRLRTASGTRTASGARPATSHWPWTRTRVMNPYCIASRTSSSSSPQKPLSMLTTRPRSPRKKVGQINA